MNNILRIILKRERQIHTDPHQTALYTLPLEPANMYVNVKKNIILSLDDKKSDATYNTSPNTFSNNQVLPLDFI